MDKRIDETFIIKKVKKGDKYSFKKLYEVFSPRIFALCIRITGDRAEAEDILQEIFLHTWEKIKLFEFKSSFYTWLHRLSLNIILRRNEKLEKDSRMVLEQEYEDYYKDDKNISKEEIEEKLDFEKALLTIPAMPRKVFILYVMEGLTHKEIGDLLEINEGTSKAHLSRAKDLLRRSLGYETTNV